MASIRKRQWATDSGEQKYGWQVDYKDVSGHRRSKQFQRKKDAEAWLTNTAFEVSKGVHTPDSQSITVEKAAEMWLDRGRRENLEHSTIASYDQHVRLHIVPLCGSNKLSQLTRPLIERYRDILLDRLSRPMASRVLRSLCSIIDEAQRRGYVAQNLAKGVTIGRARREKSKISIPTKEELRALIEAAKASSDPQALSLLLLAIFAGLRASELRGLSWRNIDLNELRITVDQRAESRNVIGPPKSEAGRRSIPLTPTAVQALKKWKLACPKNDANLVFPSRAKKVMSHRYMSHNLLDTIQRAANICDPKLGADGNPMLNDADEPVLTPRYTLHDFRHAAASLWIEQRVDPKRVQSWMGHSSIQVTFDTYGHLFARIDQDNAIASAIEQNVLGDEHATQMQHVR